MSWKGILILIVATVLVTAPTGAGAKGFQEPYLDIYGGWAEYGDRSVTARLTYTSIFGNSVESATRDDEFPSSYVFGVRKGWWFRDHPRYGLALDLSFFKFEGEYASGNVLPLSAVLLYRHPVFASERYAHGRLQPYIGFGLTMLFGKLWVDLTPDVSERVSGGAGGFGVDLRGGLRFFLGRRTSVFTEFRHLDSTFSIDDEGSDLGTLFFETLEEGSAGVSSSQILFGISTRLD